MPYLFIVFMGNDHFLWFRFIRCSSCVLHKVSFVWGFMLCRFFVIDPRQRWISLILRHILSWLCSQVIMKFCFRRENHQRKLLCHFNWSACYIFLKLSLKYCFLGNSSRINPFEPNLWPHRDRRSVSHWRRSLDK